MLAFRRQSRSTGHRCEGPQIYIMPTDVRGSMIREGGDTMISSPGRSSKQPLPGMRLHDPLHGRQA